MVARCLNPRGGHDNPDTAVSCRRCEFLMEGARVGNYQITAFIGSGSYGHVYQVRESEPLSRTLALKVLRFDQLNDKALGSFFDEARRIATLQHPNILPVYSFGQLEDERPYLVMEYAPQTIYDLFRKADGSRRPAFAEELLPYVEQAAQALYYVHQNGLIHQDVKPGNLLIGRNGQLLLSDFGTTFYLGMQTHASLGEVTGTAAYMAPEQWQGNPRRESDQYALAICCYELLTGRLPFTFNRLEEMWRAHLHEPPPPPQQWNPRLPAEVAAVLLRALSKDYHQRYHDIQQFASAYAEAVATALQRYVCERCGFQNRSGAQRCSNCGADYDDRTCPYCQAPVRFGQRCCSACGRLTIPPTLVRHSPLLGISIRQGRYDIKRVLKSREETRVTTMVASDHQANGAEVVLKRWECTDFPLARRAQELAYYDHASEALARLRHPLVPQVRERFAEGRHYYVVLTYIDGESLEERLQKLLRPLPEREVVVWFYSVLNILAALEQQQPPLYHFDISPANILIERQRGRAMLTGFQIPPPPLDSPPGSRSQHRTTRKLALSPYLPIKDRRYDQRTCIYMLAASIHHVLTNQAPPHYPVYPPVRQLNPAVSPALEALLTRALQEEPAARYQTYQEMQRALKPLLP
ncbi:protein kinase domain-containing protein [Thermogemmatispora carboxidivorans]|uniref:protein kinase domain-containing protein n=1 Tax=Thermogemmatispora carboxidivorans TaxID=1382306 RepID=UPI00069B336E|nr:protein kinase [Thermogemmatispora carboxidivorans]